MSNYLDIARRTLATIGTAAVVAPVATVAMRAEPALPDVNDRSETVCGRCGSRDYIDVLIHGGRSTRRDCRRCGRFIDFPVWYGS